MTVGSWAPGIPGFRVRELSRRHAVKGFNRAQPWWRGSTRSSRGVAGPRERSERRPAVTARMRSALAIKRGLDVAGATTAAIILSPVVAWTALAVAATQGLPILFRQERPGFEGRLFTMYKFRTMRAPHEGEVWYMTDEQRISPVGRFLRSTSLDELPELWNVLRGEMSLVGPRPLLKEYLETYSPDERRRHNLRPGITGWAAVKGRHALEFRDRLKLDVWYVDHWSLWLDLKIIALTVAQVLHRTDVATTQDLERVGFPLRGVGGRAMTSMHPAAQNNKPIFGELHPGERTWTAD